MVRDRLLPPTDCFEFVWRRRVKGPSFRWKTDPRFGRLLAGPPDAALQPYEPLVEASGLFLNFVRLDGSEDSFKEFADEYGRLGTYYSYDLERMEPLEEWIAHHRWLQFLAELRRELRKERPQCGKYVRWENDEAVFTFPAITYWGSGDWRHLGTYRERITSERGSPLFKNGDTRGPTYWFLASAIEDWLRTMETFAKPVALHMTWSEELQQPQLVLKPTTLLGAMVCQLAAALHGHWPFQECARCHKFFRLAPGVNRANRLTCSITCKQYLHNQRIRDARDLFARGRTVREIVTALKVKPHKGRTAFEIVKNWIDKSDGPTLP
jgi:hypothetical protein